MLFNSLTFLYLFLPVCLVVVFAVPQRFRNAVLLLASLVFYAWGGLASVPVLIGSILMNYLAGLAIGTARTAGRRKAFFITGVVLNLLLLFTFKYTHLLLTLGISFYTFKAITYLVYAYGRGEGERENVVNFALYLSFFPTVIAGPIDRYLPLSEQINSRTLTFANFSAGISRFSLGLFKKLIIAGPLAYVSGLIFGKPAELISTPEMWLGAATYMLQVYYDFSAYTDMAIGLGRMFGFNLSENFNFPYLSRSIREFWKRWHITLSTWLRDYLFQPIATGLMRSLNKDTYLGISAGNFIYFAATLVTFTLCGLWHGAALTFVLWGLIHGVLLSLEKTSFGRWLDRAPRIVSHIYLIMSLMLSFVIFRADTLPIAAHYIAILFGIGGEPVFCPGLLEYLDREYIIVVILAILGSTRFFENFRVWITARALEPASAKGLVYRYGWSALSIMGLVAALALVTMALVSGTSNSFIYFKF